MTQPESQRLAQGLLIVFEGLDGAGKTTQARRLSEQLRQAGYDVVSLKEPTDGPWGQQLRRLVQEGRQGVTPETELAWFIEDRRQDVAQNIRPALARGQLVILDRYYFSNMAYQGALGIDPEVIQRQNEVFAPPPTLLFLLEISAAEGLRRLQKDRRPDHFERLDYLQRVAALFAEMQFPYLRRISATRAPENIHACIWQEVQTVLAGLQDNHQFPEGV
ncbi:MAG TPA: dTMP kinase [Candidatus Tectomicrobia bacterium]|jgi:dTMP kinase